MTSQRRHRMGLLLALLLVRALSSPTVADAWSNGPGGDGFGTHDWVLDEANRYAVSQGYTWLDWPVAQKTTDDPDTRLRDTYHHVYDVWGSHYGDSPTRVAELYGQAVAELKRGDRAAASRTFGLLSHYWSDTCSPLHTDQTPAEEGMHSEYELDAQQRTDSTGENRAWIAFRGIRSVRDPAKLTRDVATAAHGDYGTLVGEYNNSGYDARVDRVTQTAMNRAVNGLADMIASVAVDSGSRVATPGSSAETGSVETTLDKGGADPPALAKEPTTATGEATTAPVDTGSVASADPSPPAQAGGSRFPIALAVFAAGAVFLAALLGALAAKKRAR
jgi:hypothetical protein